MWKKTLGFGVVLAAFVFLVARAEKDEFQIIDVDQAVALLKAPNTFVFDANSKSVFEAAHLPNARWVPFRSYDAKELPQDKEASLLFYCKNEY